MAAEPHSKSSFVVSADQAGERIDRLVAHACGVSRRVARIWIAQGRVRVSKRILRFFSRTVRAGVQVEIAGEAAPIPSSPSGEGAGSAFAKRPLEKAVFRILYLDRWMVAIDKPAGLLSEGRSPSAESLMPGVLRARGEREKLWLVHRLDAHTSGVLLFARSPQAARALGEEFRSGKVRKHYLALCAGTLQDKQDVNQPIARAQGRRHQVAKGGKAASTVITPLAYDAVASLVCARPRTGRTHQIRVHLAYLGHPILGDGLYGGPRYWGSAPPMAIGRTMLHASSLRVAHPKTGDRVGIACELPEDFVSLAQVHGFDAPGNPAEDDVGMSSRVVLDLTGFLALSRVAMAAEKQKKDGKKKRKASKKRKPKLTAQTADKHLLYQSSVQDTSMDIRFIDRVYRKKHKRYPTTLREDFCGTALLCADWVRGRRGRRALGIDLHGPTLAWARRHNIAPLEDQAQFITLKQENVLAPQSIKADVSCAFNFSYCIFKKRQDLLSYFRAALDGLAKDGAFFLDIHGGLEATAEVEEETKHKGFTYVWDQIPYDPISGNGLRYIHFRFPDGTEMRKAFIYDWRIWSLPEMRDALYEAGFSEVDVYWEGADEDGSGNGIFRKTRKAEQEESWIAYVVAWR